MNRIATRTMTLFLLCTFLLGGFGFFLAEYFVDSEAWVLSSGSPHIYTGENIACGVVVDRNGKLLLDMNDGRKYSNVPALRQSTVHWIGDRYGSVSAPALPNYASELAGFDGELGLSETDEFTDTTTEKEKQNEEIDDIVRGGDIIA